MEIEWDEAKNRRNIAKHGLPFALAELLFAGQVLELGEDRSLDYGEARFLATGLVNGRVLTVVYAWRGTARRIISLRRATKGEADAYYQGVGG